MWRIVCISLLFMTGAVTMSCRTTGRAVVASAERDLNADGKRDRISIVMVSGRKYDDEDLWSGMGKKYEGKFDLCVKISGQPPVHRNLNRLMYPEYEQEQPLFFWSAPWRIYFADYNHDGQIDFNLGQHGGSNGWDYRLFTVDPSGGVSELQMEHGETLMWPDRSNSTDQIHPTDGGFWYRHYDQQRDWLKSTYAWSKAKGRFVIEKEEPEPPQQSPAN